ncbi:MAG: hypothetical protein Kow009_07070 [Spirochaetales bacterium]
MRDSYPILSIALKYEQDVVLARQRARLLASLLGFGPTEQTRISTAVSEIARNAYVYGGGGEVRFSVSGKEPPQVFRIEVQDSGPGISNLEEILSGNYKSSTGMGAGLIGSRQLMDTFQIQTAPGKGTLVIMGKVLPPGAPRITPEILDKITRELSRQHPQDPFQEIQQQNQELIRAMNELKLRQEQLERLNKELADTNRGVVALYTELEEKAASLQRANEVKTRFLSNMSHEFRTPLNTILSLTQLLLDRVDGELTEEQEKQVLFIRKSAENLLELINDLLDLARIEAGKITLSLSDVSVKDLFSTLRGMLRPILVNPAVDLVFEDPEPDISLHSDEGKISQILRNLISNAIKFTERGEIRVKAELDGGKQSVTFSVSDTGIGIPEDLQEKIFQEYFQVDTPIQRKHKGTGLGLPISKKLAELLGGTLTVESSPGLGSTFSLILPLVHPQKSQTGKAEGEILIKASRNQPDELKETILLIEDEETIALLYEKYLKGTGFKLLVARNLSEARELLSRHHPCAIILDLLLKQEDGWPFLAELKSDPKTKDIPVLVATVLKDSDRGIALGAEDFVTKPIDRNWLVQRLHAIQSRAPIQKILTIDDDEASRYIIKSNLADTKFQILEAESGEEGIRIAEKEKPELIFLDLIMPGLSGIETLARLKELPETSSIPVIVLTSKELDKEEIRKLKEHAQEVLSKRTCTKESVLQQIRDTLIEKIAKNKEVKKSEESPWKQPYCW